MIAKLTLNQTWLRAGFTAEEAAKAREEIRETVTAEKSATLPEQKVNSIAAGRIKFYKRNIPF